MADKNAQADPSVAQVTPADVIGMIQRGLMELHTYLNQPVLEINAAVALAQLERMIAQTTQFHAVMVQVMGRAEAAYKAKQEAEKRPN